MSTVKKRTFSLPAEHAAYIDKKVSSGSFASASEVVRAGLRALQDQEAAIERWLIEEVGPTYDAVKAGTVKTLPAKEVFAELKARYRTPRRAR